MKVFIQSLSSRYKQWQPVKLGLLLLCLVGLLSSAHIRDADRRLSRIFTELSTEYETIVEFHKRYASGSDREGNLESSGVPGNVLFFQNDKLVSSVKDVFGSFPDFVLDNQTRYVSRSSGIYLYRSFALGKDEKAVSLWEIPVSRRFPIEAAVSDTQGLWKVDVLSLQLSRVSLSHPLALFFLSFIIILWFWFFDFLKWKIKNPARHMMYWVLTLLLIRFGAYFAWNELLHKAHLPLDLWSEPIDILLNCGALLGFSPVVAFGMIRYKSKSDVWVGLNYLLVSLLVVFYLYYIQRSLAVYHPVVETGGLFRQKISDIMEYGTLLLPGLLLFYHCFLLAARSQKWLHSFTKRFVYSLPGILSAGTLYFWMGYEVSPLILLVVFYAFLFLVELFVHKAEWNFAWIIASLIWLSMFTAIAIHASYERIVSERTEIEAQKILETYGQQDDRESKESIEEVIEDSTPTHRYQYALYQNGQLTETSHGLWPVDLSELSEDLPRFYRSEDSVTLIMRSIIADVYLLSFFSYNFAILSILLLAVLLILSYMPKRRAYPVIRLRSNAGLGDKIQSAIIASILFSFAIIAFITLLFFQKKFDESRNLTIRQELNLVQSALRQGVEIQKICQSPECQYRIYQADGFSDTPSETSQALPAILGRQTLQRLADKSQVRKRIRSHSEMSFIKDGAEIIGISIREESLYSTYSIDRFISTLLNVYLFLFLVTAAIAIFLSDSITRPLEALRNRLKDFGLGRQNKSLEWHKNDEIGELIRNYNEMIEQLDDSASLLAMNERDTAWREMARQVAHEIKNPLTPMKLRVQHLLMSIKRDPENATEMVNRVGETLIEQINNLSHIASEFSSFGKMPTANNQKIILNDVVASVHDLFRKREDIKINLYVPIDEIYVFADRYHVNRILTNLIKNAIQAIPQERQGKIEIRLYKDDKNAIILVQDNGTGIPGDKQASVFKPNFTTKNSGTGLGLAICSNLVDLFNGRIYFRTKPNVGTNFYVEIPLMRLKDNYDQKKRVILED